MTVQSVCHIMLNAAIKHRRPAKPQYIPLTRSRNSNRTLTMTPDLTDRLARPDDIEHLAELFDHYRQF